MSLHYKIRCSVCDSVIRQCRCPGGEVSYEVCDHCQDEQTQALTLKLHGTANAMVWAEEFVKLVKAKPSIATDEGTMVGWFANAMQTAISHHEAKTSAVDV